MFAIAHPPILTAPRVDKLFVIQCVNPECQITFYHDCYYKKMSNTWQFMRPFNITINLLHNICTGQTSRNQQNYILKSKPCTIIQ